MPTHRCARCRASLSRFGVHLSKPISVTKEECRDQHVIDLGEPSPTAPSRMASNGVAQQIAAIAPPTTLVVMRVRSRMALRCSTT